MSDRHRLGGIIHTYQKYDPKHFPNPRDPTAPDVVSSAFEHMLMWGEMGKLTDADLARAVRLDPSQFVGLGPSIHALIAMFSERKQKLLQKYETETVQAQAHKRYRLTMDGMKPPKN